MSARALAARLRASAEPEADLVARGTTIGVPWEDVIELDQKIDGLDRDVQAQIPYDADNPPPDWISRFDFLRRWNLFRTLVWKTWMAQHHSISSRVTDQAIKEFQEHELQYANLHAEFVGLGGKTKVKPEVPSQRKGLLDLDLGPIALALGALAAILAVREIRR